MHAVPASSSRVDGGVAAAGESGHDEFSPGRRCRNCHALAERRYCPDCGQATVLHPPSVGEFVHEFLGHHVAIEGPLWRTLRALLITPGRLTVEFFEGRRQRYIPPLRLYLTFSLIMFAVSGLQGGELRFGDQKIEFGMPKASETGVVFAPIKAHAESDNVFSRAVSRVAALTPEQRDTRIKSGVRQYLPYVLIVLVPVLALLMKLIYWNRGLLYGEHLVVALHAQTVAFVFALLSALPLGEAIKDGWVIVLFAHGAVALRRVYGGGWISTVIREILLLLTYSVLVGLAVGTLAVWTLLL